MSVLKNIYLVDWHHVCHGWMERSLDFEKLSPRGHEIVKADLARTGGAFPDMRGRWMVRSKAPFGVRIAVEPGVLAPRPWLIADRPWEAHCAWVTVIAEKGIFRCWYVCRFQKPLARFMAQDQAANRRFGKKNAEYVLCYAESRDGRRWIKPELGQFSFNGSRRNNIACPYGVETAVFLDESAPASERYKCFDFDRLPNVPSNASQFKRSGLYGAVSPDGIRWRRLPDPLIRYYCDTQNVGYWDPLHKKLMGYFRGHFFADNEFGGRAIARAETTNFRRWPQPEVILTPGPEDAPTDDYYTNGFVVHPDDPSLRFFFSSIYHRHCDRVDTRLAVSRDGRVFNWVARQPIVECPSSNHWAAEAIYTGPNLLRLPNGRLALPVRGERQAHNENHAAFYNHYQIPRGGLGWVTWEDDRLAGIVADNLGEFFTLPQLFEGRSLEINACSSRAGSVEVEIWEQIAGRHARPVPGFTFEDNVVWRGDARWAPCRFKGKRDLAELRGKKIELRFRLSNAKIFGYRFVD